MIDAISDGGGLLRTDVLDLGVPWTELMLRRGRGMPDELNLRWRERLSVSAVWLLALFLALAPWRPGLLVPAGACAAWLLVAHRELYGFLARRGGPGFLLGSVLLHWLYLGYCGVAFLWGTARHARGGAPARPREGTVQGRAG